MDKTVLTAQEAQKAAMRYLHAHDFLKHLKANRDALTTQQLKTLKGQALSGDVDGAMKGLGTILLGR